jgi:hypothetical protein
MKFYKKSPVRGKARNHKNEKKKEKKRKKSYEE